MVQKAVGWALGPWEETSQAGRPGPQSVVEIGPGLGTLTRGLIEAGARVWAVEKDPRLYNYLKEALPTLHLLLGDALEHPLAGLVPTGPYVIAANLPYAIASPWLSAVLDQTLLPQRLVLMLQKEAADRLTAPCGTKAYGALGVVLQSYYRLEARHPVGPQSFYPPPQVSSTLLCFEALAEPYRFAPQTRSLIRTLFTQRRKQIQALARRHSLPAAWLATLRNPQARPEAIAISDWQRLDLYG